jgi:hypothetical protein
VEICTFEELLKEILKIRLIWETVWSSKTPVTPHACYDASEIPGFSGRG